MESWRRTLSQFRDLFNNMAPGQRLTLVVVPLLVVAGLGLAMQVGVGPAEEALLSGKAFSADELKKAEAALRSGSFTQYRVEGQRILVAKAEAARYNAALVTGQGIPDNFGDDIERAMANDNPFLGGSDAQRRDRIDLGMTRELVKIIKAIPFVDDAWLVTPRPRQRGLHGESKRTATLGVRLRGGRELPGDLAQSLQQTVAGGFDMAPANVTVVDMKTGKAPRMPEKDENYSQGYVETLRHFTDMYQQTIAEALSYIPNILVSVNVEVTKAPDDGGATATGACTAVPGFIPKSVRVAVAIPRDYYREVAVRQGVAERDKAALRTKLTQLKTETERDVREKIARLIPATTSGTAADAVNVSSYDRLETVEAPATVAVTTQVAEVVTQWGGAAGLAIFAIGALWMLNRSMKRMPENPGPTVAKQTSDETQGVLAATPPDEEGPNRDESPKRDKLQSLVKENPKLAAVVLSRWLAPQR